MNSFLRGVVQRPVLVLMVFASLTVFGVWSLRQLPVDSLPKIEPPVVTVITVYPGASAPDVERKVTDPIERSLSSMSGLKHMSSVSKENVSLVTLEFEYGVNVDASMNEMRQYLDLIKGDLPSDALQPWAIRVSTSMMPTVILGVRAKKGDLRAFLHELTFVHEPFFHPACNLKAYLRIGDLDVARDPHAGGVTARPVCREVEENQPKHKHTDWNK